MRKLSAAFIASAFTLLLALAFTTPAYPALRADCNCVAPDGSCSASVSCTGGCTKFCGNNDNCYAYCSGFYGFLGTEATFEMQNASYPQLVTEVARASGKELSFSPARPGEVFNVGFKRAPLWDAFELLSEKGTVQVAGQDFERLKRLRRILVSGEKLNLCVKNTPVGTFINDMTALTGLPLRITGGSPMATVSVQLQGATLDEMITAVSEQTGTRIIEEGAGVR